MKFLEEKHDHLLETERKTIQDHYNMREIITLGERESELSYRYSKDRCRYIAKEQNRVRGSEEKLIRSQG